MNNNTNNNVVTLLPDFRNSKGGPASFQRKLVFNLEKKNYKFFYSVSRKKIKNVFLINFSRKVIPILLFRSGKVNLILRLGTPFASHENMKTSFFLRIRTWIGIKTIGLVRRYRANSVIYQSKFVKSCWDEIYSPIHGSEYIIYNGVDTELFSPTGKTYKSSADIVIASVEGTQSSPKNNPAFLLCKYLFDKGISVELLVFGRSYLRSDIEWRRYPFVKFKGFVENEKLPQYLRGATAFFSTDVIAACPNSVIEALSCGLPILGYDAGVLKELVGEDCGVCVPFKTEQLSTLGQLDLEHLERSLMYINRNREAFTNNCRSAALEYYSLERMGEQYHEIFQSN